MLTVRSHPLRGLAIIEGPPDPKDPTKKPPMFGVGLFNYILAGDSNVTLTVNGKNRFEDADDPQVRSYGRASASRARPSGA